MTHCRSWLSAALLLGVLSLSVGCVPTAEGTRDEQKNPFYLTGKERLQAMDYQGAVDSFERALQENPKSVLAHFELGVVHEVHLGDYATALYHYNKALKMRPGGYPADNIRQRIPACRQELIKADSLAVVNPAALRETEKLREENQDLRRQVTELKTALAAQMGGVPSPGAPGAVTNPGTVGAGTGAGAGNRVTSPVTPAAPLAGRTVSAGGAASPVVPGAASGAGTTPAGNSGGGRVHTVRSGETLASISRTYNVRLEALLAANRGLDPKRLKPGLVLKIPTPATPPASGVGTGPR